MYKYILMAAFVYAAAATYISETAKYRKAMTAYSQNRTTKLSSTLNKSSYPDHISKTEFALSKTTDKKLSSPRPSASQGWPRVNTAQGKSQPYMITMNAPAPSPEDETARESAHESRTSRHLQLLASIANPPERQIHRDHGFDTDLVQAKRSEAISQGPCGGPRLWKVSSVGPLERADIRPAITSNPAMINAMTRWEQDVQEAAMRYLGEPVETLENAGSYVCKRIMNRKFGPWSEHAKANAIDITGFTTLGGRHISLLGHWAAKGSESRFLRAVHASACQIFSIVLSPEFNAAHRDHFHLDLGTHKGCH